jgi:hypothetical protein
MRKHCGLCGHGVRVSGLVCCAECRDRLAGAIGQMGEQLARIEAGRLPDAGRPRRRIGPHERARQEFIALGGIDTEAHYASATPKTDRFGADWDDGNGRSSGDNNCN